MFCSIGAGADVGGGACDNVATVLYDMSFGVLDVDVVLLVGGVPSMDDDDGCGGAG